MCSVQCASAVCATMNLKSGSRPKVRGIAAQLVPTFFQPEGPEAALNPFHFCISHQVLCPPYPYPRLAHFKGTFCKCFICDFSLGADLFAKALKVASKNTISTKDQSCSGQCPVNMEEVVEAKTLKEVEMTDNNRSWWIALIVEQLVAFKMSQARIRIRTLKV